MNKIKIVYIVKNLRVNGISTVIMNYCRFIDKSKYEINIMAGKPIAEQYRNELNKLGVTIIETPPKRGKNPIKYYSFLLKNISSKKFDIVHIHGNSATVAIETMIAKIKKIKICVVHSHNTKCNYKIVHRILQPILNLLADVKLACSYEAGRWLFNKNFIVIENGFDIKKYEFNESKRLEKRDELGITDEFLIGHVGIFTEQKNHNFIIEIFEEIIKERKCKLILIGEGPKFNEIKNLIDEKGLKENIILYGVAEDVKTLYDAMDLFILPSKYEGLGIVLIEAQVNGLNCLISNSIPDSAIISINVKKISINDRKLWVDSIKNYIDDKEKIRKPAEYSQMNRFNIQKVIKELENIYKEQYKKKVK